MQHFRFDKVTVSYPYEKTPTLSDFSFELQKGEVVTLLMDVQSGKTTLCKVLCGLAKCQNGQVFFNEKELCETSESERNILFLPQTPVFFENKSVFFNVEYVLKIRKIPKNERIERTKKLLKEFCIEHLAQTKLKTLSKNERDTVALARGFAKQVDLVLCDSFADDLSKENFELLTTRSSGKTLLFLTSDLKKAKTEKIITYFDNKQLCCGDSTLTAEKLSNVVWLNNGELK